MPSAETYLHVSLTTSSMCFVNDRREQRQMISRENSAYWTSARFYKSIKIWALLLESAVSFVTIDREVRDGTSAASVKLQADFSK